MANRSTWPSADLWKRLPDIKDDDSCPWCECPAATHLRDPTVGVWYCPIQLDAPEDRQLPEYQAQKTKLWDMLRKAGGAGPFARTVLAPAELWDYASRQAVKDIEYLKTTYPDFEELRPILVRVIARSPKIGIEQAITEARTIRAAQVDNAKATAARNKLPIKELFSRFTITREQIEDSRRAQEGLVRKLVGQPGDVVTYKPDPAVQRLDRMRARKEKAKPSPVPKTVGTGKRKYNLDEDL